MPLTGHVAVFPGIGDGSTCTYLLMGDVVTTITNIDNAPFVAGRFNYLSLDPTDADGYKRMLAIALTAFAAGTRVYANVAGRHARIETLSFSTQENSNQ